ncbi:hypothetical protein G7K_1061-t1 [Saitoella complicata NRRL Y-17804]|uniref:Uncharacterized protein n=1 Tax=Saitoella complicata (strain BCRC 22490 / CBS 7301 / JCM 7358 / NBRC 10748 / NRRL Y-17804) TaxID=698492 RepID=A0A0E9NAK0_SAICN|nr:hypothetical protein G7K_1061-t1 [Saitoella complicata NRRL Y-17804]
MLFCILVDLICFSGFFGYQITFSWHIMLRLRSVLELCITHGIVLFLISTHCCLVHMGYAQVLLFALLHSSQIHSSIPN